jgi:hypothetical protein
MQNPRPTTKRSENSTTAREKTLLEPRERIKWASNPGLPLLPPASSTGGNEISPEIARSPRGFLCQGRPNKLFMLAIADWLAATCHLHFLP